MEPYLGQKFNEQFQTDLLSGQRLPKPSHASDEL
jgi:hypothetical protein